MLYCPEISPFVPAEAGTQFLQQSLGPRFRGDERSLMSRYNFNRPQIVLSQSAV